jgi:hypothetical protein
MLVYFEGLHALQGSPDDEIEHQGKGDNEKMSRLGIDPPALPISSAITFGMR